MSKQDSEQVERERAYMEMRAKGTEPYDAVVLLGFSDSFADSIAKRLEDKYQQRIKDVMNKAANSVASLSKKPSKNPLDFLSGIMNDELMPNDIRIKIAFQLLPYFAVKKGMGKPLGSKAQADQDSKDASKGGFAQGNAPKLASVPK